jgi:hypothetical protein
MTEQLRLAIRYPNVSGSGSEEEKMSRITLSFKAAKLMKLCDLEGYKRIHDHFLYEIITYKELEPGLNEILSTWRLYKLSRSISPIWRSQKSTRHI